MELRPYQLEAVEGLREKIRAGAKRPLLVVATGGGKTVIFSHIIQKAAERGSRALVIAHRRELVAQASQKLTLNGVSHGIIQAGFPVAPHRPVQVASIQTLLSRPAAAPRVDIVVIDEAHHTTTKNSYAKVLQRYPQAIVLGVTATPWRLDGRGLADVFDAHVVVRTPRQLRDEGYLVPVGGWEYEAIDTSSARVQRGDYVTGDLAASASSKRVVGDVVSEWLLHAEGARTVLFALSIDHSKLMVQAFRDAGVAAEHVDGEMPGAERDAILGRLRSGVTRVVCNCNVLTEGFDCPELECCILARPTLSTALYLQMVGRVLRPAEGKTKARVHDHAGCLSAHGHPYADRDFSPELSVKGERPSAKTGGSAATRRCPSCKSFLAGWPCDACGYAPKPSELKLEYEEAARRREILNDGVAPKAVEADTPAGRRRRWEKRYARDEGWQRDFFFRMVTKHRNTAKASRIFKWFSGDVAWPRIEWIREAEQRARTQASQPDSFEDVA